jgi:uncharacterized protein (TIGR02246 family)
MCLLLFSAACSLAMASELSADETRRAATEAVAARVQTYLQAFNRRDIDACAKQWSENAEYVLADTGTRVQGRKAIRDALAELLNSDGKLKLSVSDQRFRQVSEDVVLEEGSATIASAKHGVERAHYVVVHVYQQGVWYRDSVRETTVAMPQASGSSLHELNWLLGHWRAEDGHGSVEIHSKWMNGKRFIVRSFKVHGEGGYKLDGTQFVGWDPSAATVRSWSFDSEGGFEQATWARDGKRWLVKVNAVMPDGSVGSEQRLLTRVDNAHMTMQVIDQQVHGQLLPGTETVTLVRQAKD